MAKIKHIALSTQDADRTAKFYIDVFGMKEIAKIDSPGARGYYLSDGDINLAILNTCPRSSTKTRSARARQHSLAHIL
jgi:catechol 2,3-dioxygenase-like lactoylglutathione lyase family enzyme